VYRAQPNPINKRADNHTPTCAEMVATAEQELAAFVAAVRELYGSEQAMLSAEDWLEELALMDRLPGSTTDGWRLVTVAASARLASRLTHAQRQPTPVVASNDGKLPTTALSNSFPTASPGVMLPSQASQPGNRGVARHTVQSPLKSFLPKLS
jgi:hypothetical protein